MTGFVASQPLVPGLARPALTIEVICDALAGEAPVTSDVIAGLRQLAATTAKAAASGGLSQLAGWQIDVILTNAAAVQSLNARYRGKDRPTNVLSFPYIETAPTGPPPMGCSEILGELYVSLPTARQEARKKGASEHDYLAHLVCHGVLHLFGFDHLNEVEANAMEDQEAEILTQAGYANPYDRHDG